MPGDRVGERTRRDGKIGWCDECGEFARLSLSRNGFRCSDCLTGEDLADMLNLRHTDSIDQTEVSE